MQRDYSKELEVIKNRIEDAKTKRSNAKGRLEAFQKTEEEIIENLNKLGVSPENISLEIEKLESEIASLIDKANEYMPKE